MKIEKTNNTPAVHLSLEDNLFSITGNSFSDAANDIFIEIINWIDLNIPKLENELVCHLSLSVFNSVTYKNLLNIFQKFEIFIRKGKKIRVDWFCDSEDEDILELVEDIKELYNIPLEIRKK